VACAYLRARDTGRGAAKRYRSGQKRQPVPGGATVLPVIVYYNGERLAPDRVRLRQGFRSGLTVADDETGRRFRGGCSKARRSRPALSRRRPRCCGASS